MRSIIPRPLIALVLATIGCAGQSPSKAPSQPAAAPAMTDRDWLLVSLGDRMNPMGAGNRPVTIRFESASPRAAGFAGCNRFNGSYTLAGDSLGFGPVASTKMACSEGMDVEQGFLAVLSSVKRFQISDSTLTLIGPAGPLARFHAR
jgi:heat shock protein HslJ